MCESRHLLDGMPKAIIPMVIHLQTHISSPMKGFTMRHCMLAVLALLTLAFTQAVAQNKSVKHSLAGAKIYIAPMKGNLHPFIATEIVKKKLPLVVVTEKKKADYILAGSFIKSDEKWHHTAFGVTDQNEGSVRLINLKNQTLVWAGGAGDRSLFLGGWNRGGQSKVAGRIVNKMKKDLFSYKRNKVDHTKRNKGNTKGSTTPNTGKSGTKTSRS